MLDPERERRLGQNFLGDFFLQNLTIYLLVVDFIFHECYHHFCHEQNKKKFLDLKVP